MNQIELNTIYNEDCLDGMKRIPDKSLNCIICDLPYGTTECNWDKIIPLEELWKEYKRVIMDNGVIILFAQQPFTSRLVMSNLKMYNHSLVWEKDCGANFMCARYRPIKVCEDIIIFSKGSFTNNAKIKCTYNPIMTDRKKMKPAKPYISDSLSALKPRPKKFVSQSTDNFICDKSFAKNIIYFPVPKKGRIHPTQKPIDLVEYLIRTYTNEGEIILDNCMGSGTTAIACINTGRNFIGFEKDKVYYEDSLKRLRNTLSESKLAI